MKEWIILTILTQNNLCFHKLSFNMKLAFETYIPFKYLWNQMNLLPTKSVNLEFHKLDHLYFSGRVFFPEVKFTFSHEFFNSTTSSSSSSPKSFYTSHKFLWNRFWGLGFCLLGQLQAWPVGKFRVHESHHSFDVNK